MKLFAAALLVVAPLAAFADGVPDSTFGDGGSLTIAFPSVDDVAEQVMDGVVDAQGRYVSVGFSNDDYGAPQFSAQISRHLPSGAPDVSVNSSGVIRFNDGATGNMFLLAVASRGDGVVAIGLTDKTDSNRLVVCRFDDDLDMQADRIDDVCLPYNIPVEQTAMDVQILPDDKVLVLSADPGDEKSYRLTRLDSDGSIDLTFGECGCGYVYNDGLFENKLEPAAMAIDPVSGAIVVASFETIFSSEVVVTRHLENGAIDKSFSGDGYVPVRFDMAAKILGFPFDVASSVDRPVDVVVLPDDGSVLVMASILPVPAKGEADVVPSEHERVGIAKILEDGALEPGFGNVADRAIFGFGMESNAWAMPGALSVLPDGRLLAAGTCIGCNEGRREFAAMRLLANGKIDKSWGYPDEPFDAVVVTLGDEDDSTSAQVTAVATDDDRVVMFGYRIFPPYEGDTRADGAIARLTPQRSDSIFSDAFEGD